MPKLVGNKGDGMAKPDATAVSDQTPNESGSAKTSQRKIPGNLPYLTASGTLKKVLDRIIEAQQPPRFNADFLENVLNLTGGGARATIPILKKMGFVASDGAPTALYSKFRTNGGRSAAALQGMQNAFAEIFRKSGYAHTATDAKIKDVIVEITGLSPTDPVAAAIKGTFSVLKSYVPSDTKVDDIHVEVSKKEEATASDRSAAATNFSTETGSIRLAYNINIVLPETADLNVLNAIFRSIKENLMK
jgi:hypothetical protein